MPHVLHTLQAVPGDHAFAQLSSSDNIIAFTTARYSQQPLVIRCASQSSARKTPRLHVMCGLRVGARVPLVFSSGEASPVARGPLQVPSSWEGGEGLPCGTACCG